ncbi:MAG: phosphoheptose isomerase [Bacteroidia bacterium]
MDAIFKKTEIELLDKGYTFDRVDFERPWGGFFVIERKHREKFIEEYFTNHESLNIDYSLKISPKILLVAPEKRLSWQYHHRRSEIWQVVEGDVGIVRSKTDQEQPMKTHKPGEQLEFTIGERHRLVGLENWGKVAEIWIHTDPNNPSDENDIVRLQDDFKRS